MKEINFSKFDKFFVILKPVIIPDDYGGYISTWEEAHRCWGRLKPIIHKAIIHKSQAPSLYTHELVMRYNKKISVGSKVICSGKAFIIDSITNWEEKDRFMVALLIAEEKWTSH